MRMIRFVWCRAEPEIIVQLRGNPLRCQVCLPRPVEFPLESRRRAYRHGQRPAEKSALSDFLEVSGGPAAPVEHVFAETKPGVDTKHPPVHSHRFNDLFSFGDGPRHRLFAPDVLAGLCSSNRNKRVPVRRRGYVDDVDVTSLEKFAEILVALDPRSPYLHSIVQMVFVDITDCQEASSGIPEVPAPHPSNADHRFRELIARWCVPGAPKNVPGNDAEGSERQCRLDKRAT